MQITYFFRKPSPSFHSIEKLFSAIIQNMPAGTVKKHYSKYSSNGLIKRILIARDAQKNQGEINHITGDIHFVALLLQRRKTILTIHDIGIIKTGNFFKRHLIKLIWFDLPLRSVKKVTVISEFTKNELVTQCKVNPDKVVVIPNCYPDIYKFAGVKERNGKPVILHIGTKQNKNLERLIAALSDIGCILLIVGNLTTNQINLLVKNQIEYENHFNLSENEMFKLYLRSDLLAYVSTYEGFGVPVIEANAVGRPVLASNIEPIRSVATNAALLVDPFSTEDIKKGILRIINDTDFCKELINNGFENSKKYHPQKIVKEYLAVYESIISEK